MSRRGLRVKNLEKWQKSILELEGEGVDRLKDRVLRSAAFRTQEYLDDLTPVSPGGGRLKGSMSVGDPDNVFKLVVGKRSYVMVGTAVEYAQYVNDGFSQEKGRFVPGEWKSGVFHYIPGHSEGMVLTGKVVPGARMFDKAMDYMEDDIGRIMEFEFRRLYKELF